MLLAAGLAVSLPGIPEPGLLIAPVILAANALWRTWRPLALEPGDTGAGMLLLVDLGLHVAVVALTGGFESPYVFTVLVDVLLAGFGRGYPEAFTVASLATLTLAVAQVTIEPPREFLRSASQVALVYLLTAVVAGYARGLFVEADVRQEEASDRVARLSEANELLAELHRVAQTLPSSLDLEEILSAATTRLRELFDLTAVALLVRDPATATWRTGMAEGVRLSPELGVQLPPVLARAADGRASVAESDFWASGASGLSPRARSGLYRPLVARDHLIGLAAIEHSEPDRFGPREVDLMDGLAEPLALALDNALWFARLRVLGAEGERSRMARQLHDRVGQGLAYVVMELERIRSRHGLAELEQLATDTRGLLGEVRETLHQLRTDVTESASLAAVAEKHLERFQSRTGIQVTLHTRDPHARLPVRVERELWRILQEALLNVEQHAGAERVWVTWEVEGQNGRLQVRDDGRGFDPEDRGRSDTHGMMAMRERANAVGGRLEVRSAPDQGTLISVETEVHP